jgi:magnesium transporter
MNSLMLKLERTNFLGLNEEEKELLNDLVVDNSQALEMANIYSNILTSTLDAFASIIANNQNEVLKTIVRDHDRPLAFLCWWQASME